MIRKIVIGSALIIGLPVALVLILVGTLYVLNQTSGAIVSSGEKREYLLHVPKSCDRAKRAPLVISLHGAAGWPAHEMNTSRWNRLADERLHRRLSAGIRVSQDLARRPGLRSHDGNARGSGRFPARARQGQGIRAQFAG